MKMPGLAKHSLVVFVALTAIAMDGTAVMSQQTYTPGHLYVAQGSDIRSKVFRYPLGSNGLPSTKPDGALDLDFIFPGSIAIGPDGDLYVASAGSGNNCGHRCFVDVFAPGASGRAKAIRRLYVSAGPLFIAVDTRGYLDVHSYKTGYDYTDVYLPNASGHDRPINQFMTPGVNWLTAWDGVVYIQTSEKSVESVGQRSNGQGAEEYQYPYYSADGVTTDGTFLYAAVFYQEGRTDYLGTYIFDIRRPSAPVRTIIGLGCTVHVSGGALGYGMAVYKHYLFESCIDGKQSGVVQVYDTAKSGMQRPVMQVRSGLAGVAIGP